MNTYMDAEQYNHQLLAEQWNPQSHARKYYPQFQQTPSPHSTDAFIPKTHQMPWRSFAFASDLGNIGYMIQQPKLGLLGWLVALPYYGYSIFSQPHGEKRKEEIIYQATANCLFPMIEVKTGSALGGLLQQALKRFYPNGVLSKIQAPVYKISGGLLMLLSMTPILGDPMSQRILDRYRSRESTENCL